MKILSRKLLYCIAIVFLFLVSCSEKDASPVILLVSPNVISQNSSAGENLLYGVEAYSNVSSSLAHFSVTCFDPIRGLLPMTDSVLTGEKFSCAYPFVVPEFSQDSVLLQLNFNVADVLGNEMSMQRYILVTGGALELDNFESITMYASGNNRPDAYDLSANTPIIRALADSSEVDIYVYKNEEDLTEALSGEWRSYTGVKFVRFNEFNYATATQSGIESSYSSGIPQNAISDIAVNDVILVGKENKAIGVIKIVAIQNNDNAPRCYIFSLKKIRNS